ncbi:Ff.00g066770.m01.CDS01 [Fusarium sp. VM40]|nr:Ff.00g066770.m01.CDS01 [Fusarium sp. VM40]
MAEAIGVAGSIVGLIQFTGTIFKLVFNFCKEVKDAPRKAQELVSLIRDLAGMLESLRLLGTALEANNPKSFLRPQHLQSFKEILLRISKPINEAQSDFDSGKGVTKLRRRLKWPFTLPETNSLFSDLQEHRANIQLALSADSMDTLLHILERQDTIQRTLERKVSFDIRVQLDKKRKDIMNYFLVVNPQTYLDISSELRHEATGLWLTERTPEFANWKSGLNSRLWLSGIAGGGKTVLCGLVIETLLEESNQDTAVCYAFCDYKTPDTWSPSNIIAALIVQLGLQSEEAFEYLEEYYNDLHAGDKLPGRPKIDRLVEVFKLSAEAYDKVFIIVDGLDECGTNISEMTLRLKSLVDDSPSISAAFFSRPEDEISDHLSTSFEHIKVFADMKDLEDFTVTEVGKRQQLRKLKHKKPDLYEEILRTLVHGAQGMFRWVACQIDHICDQPSQGALRRALKILPSTLFETYDRVIEKLMKYDAETQACLRKILQWTALKEPKLTIPALCEAVSIKPGVEHIDDGDVIEPDAISRLFGCLLHKSLDGKFFEFSHFTVLEYLETEQAGEYRFREHLAYQSFAETAVTFLLLNEVARNPSYDRGAERSYQSQRDLEHPFYQIAVAVPLHFLEQKYPYLARTAVLEEEPVLGLLKQLFERGKRHHFRSWVYKAFLAEFPLHTIFTMMDDPLLVASYILSPRLCEFLLQRGMDLGKAVISTSPLAQAIFSIRDESIISSSSGTFWTRRQTEVLRILLDHGADLELTLDSKSCLAYAFTHLSSSVLVPFVRATTAVPVDAIEAFFGRTWNNDHDNQLLVSILLLSDGKDTPPQWKPITEQAIKYAQRRDLSIPANLSVSIYSDSEYVDKLAIAIKNGSVDSLEILVDDRRFPDDARGCEEPAFRLLSSEEDEVFPPSSQIFKILLDLGLNPNAVDSSNRSFLHICCQNNNVGVIDLLLSHGADPSLKDKAGQTAWHAAASEGSCEVLSFLLSKDIHAIDNLASHDLNGRTPFHASLANGQAQSCLFLLNQCQSEPNIFQLDHTALNHAATIGSEKLFTAILNAKGFDKTTTKCQSTPMHFLSATCTAEFAQWLGKTYDPLALDKAGKSPFELFFHRWLVHNELAYEDETLPLDTALLRVLLPLNFLFEKGGKPVHTWSLICDTLGPDMICCFVDSQSESYDVSDSTNCRYFFSDTMQQIISFGVLSSFENTIRIPAVVPLIKALIPPEDDIHFCHCSISPLITQVMDASELYHSLGDFDDSYSILRVAMQRNQPALVFTLINYGVDTHRLFPKIAQVPASRSPFEMACLGSNIEIFRLFVDSSPEQSFSNVGPSGSTPLEMVVKGTSEDKMSKVRELYPRVDPLKLRELQPPIILQAAREEDWDIVKCLGDLGEDIDVLDEDGWGLAQRAIQQNNLEIVKWLFSMGSTLGYRRTFYLKVSTEDGEDELVDEDATLLHFACDSPDIMGYLLKRKLFDDINVMTERGRTPSHLAAFTGSFECCRLLIQHGANVSILDRDNKLPFDYAFDNNFGEVGKLLFPSGSNSSKIGSQGDSDRGRDHSSQRLIELDRRHLFEKAILAGELEKCKEIASHGLSLDLVLPSCGKCTPLSAAIRSQKENVVQWLLETGAKPTNVFCDHNTHVEAVMFAFYLLQSQTCLSTILTSARQHPTLWSMSLTGAIYYTVNKGDVEMLSKILEDLNRHLEAYCNARGGNRDVESETLSAPNFGPVFVNELVSYDNPARKETSLHCAAREGYAEIIHMLVKQGAKIDSRDGNEATPLFHAAQNDHSGIAKILIEYGASVDLKDDVGYTAMVYAVMCGNIKTAQLLHRGSPFAINFMSVDGSNLLAQDMTSEMFQYLISMGLDPEHLDRSGVPMAHLALGWQASRQCIFHSRLKIPSAPNIPFKRFNPLAAAVLDTSCSTIKQLYLVLPPLVAAVLINDEDYEFGSPCCNASASGKFDTVKLLLALGSNIEMEGSGFGTPLMCAIACGRLEIVKFLVRNGAKLQYTSEEGTYRSGVIASLPFPEVTRWLLVERFRDQPRLGNGVAGFATDQIPWSGKRTMRVALRDWELRRWGESSLEFCTRLEKIKRGLNGRTVKGQIIWNELET